MGEPGIQEEVPFDKPLSATEGDVDILLRRRRFNEDGRCEGKT